MVKKELIFSNLFVVANHECEDQSEPEGLSLTGYNPELKDFFEMPVATAEALRKRLIKDYPEVFTSKIKQKVWQYSTKQNPDEWRDVSNDEYEHAKHLERYNWRQIEK